MSDQEKPQIHVSMLTMFAKCPIQFQRRYGARFGIWHEEEIIPPGVALIQGTVVHKAAEQNLNNKIDEGILMSDEQIADITKDEFELNWGQEILLTDEESENVAKTKGEALDLTLMLSTLHHVALAPLLNPVAVEEKFVIVLDDFPFDISGTKDVREKDSIRDLKTMKQSPTIHAPRSLQMGMYSLSEKIERGSLPEKVCIDALVKTKIPKLVTQSIVPDDKMIQPVLNRLEAFAEIIENVKKTGVTLPAASPDHWCCSKKFCGYSQTCPFWSGI